jgi:hypothetical protein
MYWWHYIKQSKHNNMHNTVYTEWIMNSTISDEGFDRFSSQTYQLVSYTKYYILVSLNKKIEHWMQGE